MSTIHKRAEYRRLVERYHSSVHEAAVSEAESKRRETPSNIGIKFSVAGRYVHLNLTYNEDASETAPVFIGEDDAIVAWKPDEKVPVGGSSSRQN